MHKLLNHDCFVSVCLCCLLSMPAVGHGSETDLFSIHKAGDVPDTTVENIRVAIKQNYQRIKETLEIEELPYFVVRVWGDPTDFRDTFATGGGRGGVGSGYVNTELMEIRVLDEPDVAQIAVHEFSHLAMLAVNGSIPGNPLWLWEAAALYLDGSEPPLPEQLSCVSADHVPLLADLGADNTRIYHLGWYLADYIVDRWGNRALVSLIRTNGDIEQVLGIEQREFERAWRAHLLSSYEFPSTLRALTGAEMKDLFTGNRLVNRQSGLSTDLDDGGRFLFRMGGDTQVEGGWYLTDDKLCLELGSPEPRCSTWYRKGRSTYLLAPDSDCIFQEWELESGEAGT